MMYRFQDIKNPQFWFLLKCVYCLSGRKPTRYSWKQCWQAAEGDGTLQRLFTFPV